MADPIDTGIRRTLPRTRWPDPAQQDNPTPPRAISVLTDVIHRRRRLFGRGAPPGSPALVQGPVSGRCRDRAARRRDCPTPGRWFESAQENETLQRGRRLATLLSSLPGLAHPGTGYLFLGRVRQKNKTQIVHGPLISRAISRGSGVSIIGPCPLLRRGPIARLCRATSEKPRGFQRLRITLIRYVSRRRKQARPSAGATT